MSIFRPVLPFQIVVVACLSVFQFLHSLGSFLMIDGQAQRDLVNMMEALVRRFGARARLSTQVGLLMSQGAMPGPDSFKEWWEARTDSAQLSAPSGPKSRGGTRGRAPSRGAKSSGPVSVQDENRFNGFSVGRFQDRPCVLFLQSRSSSSRAGGESSATRPGPQSSATSAADSIFASLVSVFTEPFRSWCSVLTPLCFPCIFQAGSMGAPRFRRDSSERGEPRAEPQDGGGDGPSKADGAGAPAPEEVIDVTEDEPLSGRTEPKAGTGSGPSTAREVPAARHFQPIINDVTEFEEGFVNWPRSGYKLSPAEITRWETRIDQVFFLSQVHGIPCSVSQSSNSASLAVFR